MRSVEKWIATDLADAPTFGLPLDPPSMDLSRIRPYAHKHCRFKLRSGKQVYGVIWEVEVAGQNRIYFASVRDYERLQQSTDAVQVIPMQPEEIVGVESLAS